MTSKNKILEEQTKFNRNVTKLFKKWIVRRENGNCQILFALTELDGFIEEIEKTHNQALDQYQSQLIEELEGMKTRRIDSPRSFGDGDIVNVAPGFNKCLDQVIKIVKGVDD